MRRLTASAVAAFLIFLPTAARADALDDLVRAQMDRQHVPGVTLAVLRRGEPVTIRAYGLANVELNAPTTPDSVFKLASVSKQFIAAGTMLLAHDGKLALDDSISKHLPDAPDAWQRITIRHLLTHTSGFPRELPGWSALKEMTDTEVIAAAAKASAVFAPGERWQYCNTGYFLLSVIISKTSGKPWGEFLKERLFDPLGMAATRVTTTTDLVPHRADGYDWTGNGYRNAAVMLAVRPSGGLLSSIPDLIKWEQALLAGKPLSHEALAQMWTPVTLTSGKKYPYGLGWTVDDVRGVPAIRHGGSLPGFRSSITRFPAAGVTVIVLANSSSADAEGLARRVAARYVPDLDVAALKPKPDPDPDTGKRLREVLVAFAGGANDPAGTTAELRAELPKTPAVGRRTLAGRMKEVKSFEFLARRDLSGQGMERFGVPVARVVHYRLTADQPVDYTFYLTADGTVAQFEQTGP